jgi:hypothetical protein
MIKTTAETEVRSLIAALAAPDLAKREAAVARLIIIGNRAIGRLTAAYEAAPARETRLGILRVLEASGDARALDVARHALGAGGDVAVAAVAVLRELLARGSGVTHAQALDTLLALSTDARAEHRVRAAAIEALDSAPDDVRQAVGDALPEPPSSDDAIWEDAVEGHLPDNPDLLRTACADHAERAPLTVVRQLIERLKDRERLATIGEREAWCAVRGALHQALALRGSKIALYDLRETLDEAAHPLPSGFLAAIHLIGDDSCLEPLATAFSHASPHQRWRHQLAQAFHVVIKRERLTKKHAAMRKALARAPEIETT